MSSFGEDLRRYGLHRVLVARFFSRLERHFGVHVWCVQTRPLHAKFDMPEEHATRFTFKRLTLNEALKATDLPALQLTGDFVRDAFDRDDICLGAFEDDKLVAYVWRTLTCAPAEDGLWIRLHKGGCRYGYNALVLPAYRGMRLNTSVARFYDHRFLDDGVDTDVTYVALSNLASLKSLFRDVTRKRVGYAGYIKLGRSKRTFRTPAVRAYLSLLPGPPV